MLTIRYYSSFKKDFKRIAKRGYDISKLDTVILMLAQGLALPERYRDHALAGNYAGCR